MGQGAGVRVLVAVMLSVGVAATVPAPRPAQAVEPEQTAQSEWLDPTYGLGGVGGDRSGSILTLMGRTVDASGRALVATHSFDGLWHYALRRLTAGGDVDETFAGGLLELSFDPAAVNADADGTVTVAGRGPGGSAAVVARYTDAGTPDWSFGDSGSVDVATATHSGDSTRVMDLVERDGGGLFVLVDYVHGAGGPPTAFVVALSADGDLHTSWAAQTSTPGTQILGSYKPRMLALTGELADGWLPSMEYIEGGVAALPGLNARIDEAARAAGRSPEDVRRLMNFMNVSFAPGGRGLLHGRPAQWVEQLADLALSHGITAYNIGGDDVPTTERFAAEVAPAVRELVARERQSVRPPG